MSSEKDCINKDCPCGNNNIISYRNCRLSVKDKNYHRLIENCKCYRPEPEPEPEPLKEPDFNKVYRKKCISYKLETILIKKETIYGFLKYLIDGVYYPLDEFWRNWEEVK